MSHFRLTLLTGLTGRLFLEWQSSQCHDKKIKKSMMGPRTVFSFSQTHSSIVDNYLMQTKLFFINVSEIKNAFPFESTSYKMTWNKHADQKCQSGRQSLILFSFLFVLCQGFKPNQKGQSTCMFTRRCQQQWLSFHNILLPPDLTGIK